MHKTAKIFENLTSVGSCASSSGACPCSTSSKAIRACSQNCAFVKRACAIKEKTERSPIPVICKGKFLIR